MHRSNFLTLLSLGAGAAFTGCLGGCGKDDDAAPTNVDFTLNLADSTNSALGAAGGFVYRRPNEAIIVARTAAGTYIAAARACTHQQTSLVFLGRGGVYQCPNHNAEFRPDGSVARQPDTGSAGNLKVYAVAQTGNTLRITG